MTNKRRLTNEINAGSMADIAFLLLIFFLVTTTISEDKGILVKLPPFIDDQPPAKDVKERNVFSVFINANDELLVRGQVLQIVELKQQTKIFISNPNQDVKMAENPTNAIISLKNDRATKYKSYIAVYNELKSAYNELWEEMALARFNKSWTELHPTQAKLIRHAIPMVISEAEPAAYGIEN